MDLDRALRFAADRHRGEVVTLFSDGRPHISNVVYALQGSDVVVSVTDDRVKARNVRLDPRVVFHVPGDDFWTWVALEGTARLSPVVAAPDDGTAEELVALYRSVQGEHPDWAEFRRAMVAERRLIMRITVKQAYGQA